MNSIKQDIINLSKEQTELKANRKTVNFTGIRIVDSNQANWMVLVNKNRLRHLFFAYAVLKGKTPTPSKKVEIFPQKITELVAHYSKEQAA